jgi:hypothetical protein
MREAAAMKVSHPLQLAGCNCFDGDQFSDGISVHDNNLLGWTVGIRDFLKIL